MMVRLEGGLNWAPLLVLDSPVTGSAGRLRSKTADCGECQVAVCASHSWHLGWSD